MSLPAGRNYVTAEEISSLSGVPVSALGRDKFPYKELSDIEIQVINKVFDTGLDVIRKVAPSIAGDIAIQRQLAILFAGVAKALMDYKNYSFPSVGAQLGVNWLFPQAVKYNANVPTGYNNDSWDIPITAGTPAYLLGSSTDYYTTSSTPNQRSAILIFNNGLIEVGSTPSAEQFRLISVAKGDYGIYTVSPLVEIPVEPTKSIYQYPTPLGALFVDYQNGVKWYFMPRRSGVSTIKMLGLVFYEHAFASDVLWI